MRPKLLKIVNPVLGLLILTQMASVLVLKFAYQSWVSAIHEWTGLTLFALIILHIILNWPWIKATFLTKKK